MTDVFPTIVYLLCFVTSSACAWLLIRGYLRSHTRLLWWSGLCFLLLAGNNLAVVLDMLVFPNADFRFLRGALSLAAVSVLLFGFIWDVED